MINILKNEIPFLKECSDIELINKGLSYAKVFKLMKESKTYILKVYKDNNVDRMSIVKKYMETDQPIPKVIEYGRTNNLGFYIIMENIEFGTLEEKYNEVSKEEVFNKSMKLGEKQKILNEKYVSRDDDFFNKFKEIEFSKYNQTVELINKYQEKLPKIDLIRIKQDMDRFIEYFRNDKYFYMHMDLKADNLMLDKELLMIDYENSCLIYIPIALRCEIHHIMNNDEKAEKSKEFLKGIITGIDEKQLDDKYLNKKLAYAYLKSSFVYITGYYLNNNRFEEAKKQIEMINEVYKNSKEIENLINI